MWKKECYEGEADTRESSITSCYLSYGLAPLAGIPPSVVLPMPVADGLWTDYNDGTWPACCSGSQFDKKEEVLFEAGYVPSNSEKYPLGGIISAIQNAFHATPELICSGDAVEELRICFYKDFQPRDCASRSIINSGRVSSGSCPRYVSLPAYGSGACSVDSHNALSCNMISPPGLTTIQCHFFYLSNSPTAVSWSKRWSG
ncbi:hypothetical protein RND71_043136 [Anisodus tanguticus]|uniref:Uncharacterized protein n=1 Tax=Anisodus tanguticus TaxID=243964 RepID=A0AAE1UVF3_9SOLA|nr:hypothetical protein RND71_043136 [Anisodus tanguticus]